MKLSLKINRKNFEINAEPHETLLEILRKLGFLSVKSGGCKNGECGACAVILNGKPINSCAMLALQANGCDIETVEALGAHPEKGWVRSPGLHPLQQAFVDVGAVQCGYCTPAFILAAKTLLDKTLDPSEDEIREAISCVICRCTGYVKPVEAVKRAAAILRGDPVEPIAAVSDESKSQIANLNVIPELIGKEVTEKYQSVGAPEIKVDAVKLVQGKPAFTDDLQLPGTLTAKILYSPVAHARIKSINTEKAKALPGVVAVVTWKDLPRVVYSTAGQSDPFPGPLDMFSLDNKVRFVGDRVAFIAAETPAIAEQALKLIDVKYEELPAILNSEESMLSGAEILHDEPEYVNFGESDPKKNLAAAIRIDIGDLEQGFKEADQIFEDEYEVPKVQQVHIEPHVVLTYWDEDDRLVIRTSTQVPFHVRRILAPVLGLPIKRIRVIKPRIGGGFGGKQEVLIEDVAAHLTLITGRPVRLELTREEEFTSSRSRHPMKFKLRTGVKSDGTITAREMYCLTDTGAYGCHAMTVTGNTGHKSMALYPGDGPYRTNPNIRFYADIVYTNTAPAGAFRGYGAPQGFWPVERQLDKIAKALNLDPVAFRLKNCLREGEIHPFSTAWSEGRTPQPMTIYTNKLDQCAEAGKKAIQWHEKVDNNNWKQVSGKPNLRRGVGMAFAMHGTAIPYLDMGGASIKINEDGSFNLLVGATDLGTGSDTILAQLASEVLGVKAEDMIVYSSDTDFTPFDKGAYASSTSYISGTAVVRAAEMAAERVRLRAAALINEKTGKSLTADQILLKDRKAYDPDGESVTLAEIGRSTLHHFDQEQIMGVGSYVSPDSPPPFAAQFAEVTVDIETGEIRVDRLIFAVDSGVIINPVTASGQVEGGVVQALGYGVCEEMTYDEQGAAREKDLRQYHVFKANEIPKLETIFIQSHEPTHPYGVKAIAEIPLDAAAPAIANAIYNACGADIKQIPATPPRVWEAIKSLKG